MRKMFNTIKETKMWLETKLADQHAKYIAAMQAIEVKADNFDAMYAMLKDIYNIEMALKQIEHAEKAQAAEAAHAASQAESSAS